MIMSRRPVVHARPPSLINGENLTVYLNKPREIVGIGSNSVVFSDGPSYVLVVTSQKCAENIQLLLDALKKANCKECPKSLTIPEYITKNFDFSVFFHEATRKTEMAELSQKPAFGTPKNFRYHNAIFRLPRYDGTIEDFKAYPHTLIEKMYRAVSSALDFIHRMNLTHNDIAKRNIFYKGIFPELTFYLGDYGNVLNLTPNSHQNDLARLLKVRQECIEISDEYKERKSKNDRLGLLAQSPIKKPTTFLKSKACSVLTHATRGQVKALQCKMESSSSSNIFSEGEGSLEASPNSSTMRNKPIA